jgi:hypothetical protein
MKTTGQGQGWVRALAAMALVWGLSAAAQTAPPAVTVTVTTAPLAGAANDVVVASVVDAGVMRGAVAVPVTLRILNDRGTVIATVNGTVSERAPLRLTVRVTSSAGVRAQVVLPPNRAQLSAGVLVLERGGEGNPPPPPEPPLFCPIPAKDPNTSMPEQVTMQGCTLEAVVN